jgi:hypothetical protein
MKSREKFYQLMKSNPYLKISNCTDVSDCDEALQLIKRYALEAGLKENDMHVLKKYYAFTMKKVRLLKPGSLLDYVKSLNNK